MTEFDDSPVFTWDDIVGWIRGFLAAVGLMFLAFLAGLWHAGFFEWAAAKLPGNALLAFLFGGGIRFISREEALDLYDRSDREEYGGDVDDPEDPDGEAGYCPTCNGSGEGQHECTRCSACKGKGEQP